MTYDIEKIKNKIICGDALLELKKFPPDCVDTIITSPPYWGLRDYGVKGQLGLEKTLDEYIEKLLGITAECKRVLKPTGVMYWNHGDCYNSGATRRDWGGQGEREQWKRKTGQLVERMLKDYPTKCLCLQNYRLIIQMINQGWILRNTIIWFKPNHMPSSVKDRFTNAYEPVFMLVKRKKYWFDLDAVRKPHSQSSIDRVTSSPGTGSGMSFGKEGKRGKEHAKLQKIELNIKGKNPGDVWKIPTQPFPEAHFATFPEKLIEPMILSSCPAQICKKCGKARVRIIKKGKFVSTTPGIEKITHQSPRAIVKNDRVGWSSLGAYERQTIGWTDCNCKVGWNPGIVLDPFIGSGTVGKVAKRFKRNFIGIDLKEDYCEMARQRIRGQPQPLF